MKIRRLLFLSTCVAFLSLFLSYQHPVLAQIAREDYLIKRDYYLKKHQEYLTARQTYLNYQTFQTKEELIRKLRQFLIARDEFLRVYLLVLLGRGESLLSESDLVEIKDWIDWLDQDLRQVGSIESLEELLVFANRLKNVYPEIEESVFVFLTKLTISQQEEIAGKIKQLIVEISGRASVSEHHSIFPWLSEISDQLRLIEEKQEVALEAIKEAQGKRRGTVKSAWRKSKKFLIQANLQLKEVVDFLDEIITNLED